MARPRLGESKSQRLHMVITHDEIVAIDDWRFANRIGSRSEAVRRLVRLGSAVSELLDLAEAANLPNDFRDGKYANTKRIQELRAQLAKLAGESDA